jgi:hypothetical protein
MAFADIQATMAQVQALAALGFVGRGSEAKIISWLDAQILACGSNATAVVTLPIAMQLSDGTQVSQATLPQLKELRAYYAEEYRKMNPPQPLVTEFAPAGSDGFASSFNGGEVQ